jgi:hypothetical protein
LALPEYPLLTECKSTDGTFDIRGTGPSYWPYFRPTQDESSETDPVGKVTPEDYFVSKAKWQSYSRRFQLEAAEVFISYNPEACKGASAPALLSFLDTEWLSGNLPIDEANLAMFHYCSEVLGGKKNLPKDFDY